MTAEVWAVFCSQRELEPLIRVLSDLSLLLTQIIEEFQYGGYTFPKGALFAVSIRSIERLQGSQSIQYTDASDVCTGMRMLFRPLQFNMASVQRNNCKDPEVCIPERYDDPDCAFNKQYGLTPFGAGEVSHSRNPNPR